MRCQCSAEKVRKNGAWWCDHCDGIHKTSMDTCLSCGVLKRSPGLRPVVRAGERPMNPNDCTPECPCNCDTSYCGCHDEERAA